MVVPFQRGLADLADRLETMGIPGRFDFLVHSVDQTFSLSRIFQPGKDYQDMLRYQFTLANLVDYLVSEGIQVGDVTYVETNPRPMGHWPIMDRRSRFFCGTYASDMRVISQKFSGAELNPESPLIIVSETHEYGLFFTGLVYLLGHDLGRNLDGSVPTMAFFGEVRNPETHEVTMRNQFVPVIDGVKGKPPWYGYTPLGDDGQFRFVDRNSPL